MNAAIKPVSLPSSMGSNKFGFSYIIRREGSEIPDDKTHGRSYVYTFWYTYLELLFLQSNTESYCNIARYSGVSSSKLSTTIIVRSA